MSQALSALRQSLGDPLVERTGSTLTMTPAGQRVVGLASQMVNLAVAAEEVVRVANGSADLLRVVAASNLADAVAPALLQAFNRWASNVEATLGITTTDEMRALLSERLADVALGPALVGPAAPGVISEPLLRYRLLFVAGRRHRLRRAPPTSLKVLRDEEWLVDPTATDSHSDLGRIITGLGIPEANLRVFPTQSAAWAAAAAGTGVAPAIEQLWVRDPHPDVGPVPVPGTPIEMLWYGACCTGTAGPPSPLGCTASCRHPTPPRPCTAPTAASRPHASDRPSTSRCGADAGRFTSQPEVARRTGAGQRPAPSAVLLIGVVPQDARHGVGCLQCGEVTGVAQDDVARAGDRFDVCLPIGGP